MIGLGSYSFSRAYAFLAVIEGLCVEGVERPDGRYSKTPVGVKGVIGEGGCMKRPPQRVQWVPPLGLLLIPTGPREFPSLPLLRGW